MHVIRGGGKRNGRDIVDIKERLGIEDNDTGKCDAGMRCGKKMLCMNGTGDETRLRHEEYLYAQLG